MYRLYVTKHLQLIAGTNVEFKELIGYGKRDYDAKQVVENVITKAGLEVTHEPSGPNG